MSGMTNVGNKSLAVFQTTNSLSSAGLGLFREEELDLSSKCPVGPKGGLYLTSSPIITANWEATSGNKWVIPFGGGMGKLWKVHKQPINTQLQAFYNVQQTTFGPDWTLRLQVQFLFPKGS